ncbi:MAG: fibrinogen-like YCDxxxxGGGW domain-containing protein [Candidatus Gracilibacteria bacterium]|nr:fibrinogen-like YCDxxxxGGGW domain-containing protein [Candidatus Gracilibacteria bacterium]
MKKHQTKAFTLVELIIVITILAILATIGFMSYQSHTSDARDSSRITSLKTVYDGLTISYVKKQIYPSPDDYIDIVGVSKQGYIGDTVSKSIRGEGFKDPKDNTKFLYSLDYTGKKIQLSGYLENNNKLLLSQNNPFLNQAFAGNIDYTSRYIYTIGDKVGILLDTLTNSPVNERISTGSIDLTTNTGTYTAVFSNNSTNSGTISGSGQSLLTNISIIQNSCVLGNTVVTNGGQINSYNTTSVAYNQTCTPISRTCNNGVLSGDISYKYDICSPVNALNCTATTYNGYSIPVINHGITQTISKAVTGGTSNIDATCTNGALSYGAETTTCATGYTNISNVCTAIGSVSTLPGLSCLDIKTKLTSSSDGIYWIKPDTNPAFQVYCDMTTNGGGWTNINYNFGNIVALTANNGISTTGVSTNKINGTLVNKLGSASCTDTPVRTSFTTAFISALNFSEVLYNVKSYRSGDTRCGGVLYGMGQTGLMQFNSFSVGALGRCDNNYGPGAGRGFGGETNSADLIFKIIKDSSNYAVTLQSTCRSGRAYLKVNSIMVR